MKNFLSKTGAALWAGLLVLPLQTFGQKLWDGEANDLEWTNNVNWGSSAGGTGENILPGEWDTCNFTGTAPGQTNIYVSVNSAAARIQLRANSTGPRTLQIGTNALSDVTLRISGNGVPSLLNQQGNSAAEIFTISGAPNGNGARLRLQLDAYGTAVQSIEVAQTIAPFLLDIEVSGNAAFSKSGPGTLFLNAANTYFGPGTVSAGTVALGNPRALGFGGDGTTVAAGGALDLNGQSGVNEVLTLNGTGISGAGALLNSSATPASIAGGVLSSITVTAGGSGYSSPPAVSLTGGGGSGAAAEALLGLTTASITIDNGGSGYTEPPFVYISGGGGSGAAATALLDENGVITNITVTAPGWGYSNAPTISFIGGGLGSGAAASANTANFTVSGVRLTNAGSGYTSAPTVGFSGGGGSGAAASANFVSVTLASDTSIGGSGDLAIATGVSGGFGLTKVGGNTLTLTGANTYSGATTVSAGTLLVNSPGSLAAASAVTVASGATLGGNGSIGGSVTVNAGGNLAPGASIGSLAIGGDLTLEGNLIVEVNKSVSPSNDVVTVAGTLTNAGTGTVVVTNLGPALAAGDRFQIFNQAVVNGQALSVVSSGGEVWTNKLAVDGSIEVLSAGTPAVPATNLTIQTAGPASYHLGAMGAANSAYDVYASTNLALPMSSWWLIGTTNSDAGGVIQFLDSQATNSQRFYRFGQTVP
jgi:autotransporter-associated beta strand protein